MSCYIYMLNIVKNIFPFEKEGSSEKKVKY